MLFVIAVFVFLISLAFHEFAHALTAYKMGDITPKATGRLTINPFKHVTFGGVLFFIFFGFGWAKPVPINPLNFKKYKTGTRLVSIAGILANIILGLVAAVINAILLATVGVGSVAMHYVYVLLDMFMLVNSVLAIFNLLPIYPLDGFTFITTFMKGENKFIRNSVKNGIYIMLGILIADTLLELFFNIHILSMVLTLLYNYVFIPISLLGVLLW